MTTIPPNLLWDEDSWHAISARNLKEARDAGALARLPIDLADWAIFVTWCGDFGAAAAAIAEAEAITKATGTYIAPYAQLLLAAFRGQSDALPLIESTIRDAGTGGQGLSVQWAEWVSAILFNGLGRYDRALASAQRAAEETPQLQVSPWALTELIEAAVRTARPDVAAGALERVMAATAPSSTDWGRGMQARCRALLSEGETAERLHREAIERLARTRRRPELARAHLLYGEWLRRENRRVDARREASGCCSRICRRLGFASQTADRAAARWTETLWKNEAAPGRNHSSVSSARDRVTKPDLSPPAWSRGENGSSPSEGFEKVAAKSGSSAGSGRNRFGSGRPPSVHRPLGMPSASPGNRVAVRLCGPAVRRPRSVHGPLEASASRSETACSWLSRARWP